MRQRIKAHNERPEVKAAAALTREIARAEDRQLFDAFYRDRTLRTKELKRAADTKDVTHVAGVGPARVVSLNYPH